MSETLSSKRKVIAEIDTGVFGQVIEQLGYPEEDVKEFIKNCNTDFLEKTGDGNPKKICFSYNDIMNIINKRAGEDLI